MRSRHSWRDLPARRSGSVTLPGGIVFHDNGNGTATISQAVGAYVERLAKGLV